jgi:hypothetical protein
MNLGSRAIYNTVYNYEDHDDFDFHESAYLNEKICWDPRTLPDDVFNEVPIMIGHENLLFRISCGNYPFILVSFRCHSPSSLLLSISAS